MHPAQRKIARILFDEFHSESWSVSAERAREMQPERAAHSSYQVAADLLANRDFEVARNVDQPLNEGALQGADVLVLPHPCDARWERTTSHGSPVLDAAELTAIHAFVRAGGGLLVISEYEHEKYGDNLNELLAPAGLRIENGTAFDHSACVHNNPEWLLGVANPNSALAHDVEGACFYRAGWCVAERDESQFAWQTSPKAYPPGAGLIATAPLGSGRIAVVTDSVLFGDDCLEKFGHRQLWLNLIYWLAAAKAAAVPIDASAGPSLPPEWPELKMAVNELRKMQNGDGSVPAGDRSAAAQRVDDIVSGIARLTSHFAHDHAYLEQVSCDLRSWTAGGFARPDFGLSLAAFQPQRTRENGREHLVLFPMYTPNASSDTRFEALIMRTPWPPWLAQLESSQYRNAKFVPGHLVDFTDGYASECAVLFPETVSAAARPTNQFATIFCDREARRLQRCALSASEAVGLTLFPELEFWLRSRPLIEDTVALWDLIHDASHSVGELPFDPFMIRQRAPFWMYGLEELRVDLRSFEEAARLAEQGFAFARYVTWAIVLDRVLRFPITGGRVRNYDALGGQLLFSYLHQRDILLWRDNQLTIEWGALGQGIHGLREEITNLYKRAATSSKLAFWLAGHKLISKYVRPNVGSQWKSGERVIKDEGELKRWLELVHEDEFPLGAFHLNLKRRLNTI